MNYQQIAADILPLVGGAENIDSIAHCATRLRLVLRDTQRVDKARLDALDSVKGSFVNGGQFQIVLGQGVVNHVCEALIASTGLNQATTQESKKLAAARLGLAQRLAQTCPISLCPSFRSSWPAAC
jgi:PTS system sucrose-specific IIC component